MVKTNNNVEIVDGSVPVVDGSVPQYSQLPITPIGIDPGLSKSALAVLKAVPDKLVVVEDRYGDVHMYPQFECIYAEEIRVPDKRVYDKAQKLYIKYRTALFNAWKVIHDENRWNRVPVISEECIHQSSQYGVADMVIATTCLDIALFNVSSALSGVGPKPSKLSMKSDIVSMPTYIYPSTLKAFLSKGNATKEAVQIIIDDVWHVIHDVSKASHHLYDAILCAIFGYFYCLKYYEVEEWDSHITEKQSDVVCNTLMDRDLRLCGHYPDYPHKKRRHENRRKRVAFPKRKRKRATTTVVSDR
jgi:hypothetical protein